MPLGRLFLLPNGWVLLLGKDVKFAHLSAHKVFRRRKVRGDWVERVMEKAITHTLTVPCPSRLSSLLAAPHREEPRAAGLRAVAGLIQVRDIRSYAHPSRYVVLTHSCRPARLRINSFGHLLSFKHFVPLVPKKAQKKDNEAQADSDPAQGLIPEGLSVLASMSARVGSIGDNGRGG